MVIKIKSNELNKDLIYHFNKSNKLKDFLNIIDRRSIKQIDSIIDDFDISYNDDKKPINLQELILKTSCKLFKKNKLTYNDHHDLYLNLSNPINNDIIQSYINIINENFKSKEPKTITSDESITTEESKKHVDKEIKTLPELIEKSKQLNSKTPKDSKTSKSDESVETIKKNYIGKIKNSVPKIEIVDTNMNIKLVPVILDFPKILESKINKIIKEKLSEKIKEINDVKKKDEIADLVKKSREYNAQLYPTTPKDSKISKSNESVEKIKEINDVKKRDEIADLVKKSREYNAQLYPKTPKDSKISKSNESVETIKPNYIEITDIEQASQSKLDQPTLTKKQKQNNEPMLITLTKKQDNKHISNTSTKKQDDEAILITLTKKQKQDDEDISNAFALTKKQKQDDEAILITLTKKQKQDDEDISNAFALTKKQKQDDEDILIALRDKINEKE